MHPVAKIPLIKDKIPAGFLTSAMLKIIEKGSPPSYAISFPIYYDEEDIDHLKDITEGISGLRKILEKIYNAWFSHLKRILKNNQ